MRAHSLKSINNNRSAHKCVFKFKFQRCIQLLTLSVLSGLLYGIWGIYTAEFTHTIGTGYVVAIVTTHFVVKPSLRVLILGYGRSYVTHGPCTVEIAPDFLLLCCLFLY